MKYLALLFSILCLSFNSMAQVSWTFTQGVENEESENVTFNSASEESLAGVISESFLSQEQPGHFDFNIEHLDEGIDIYIGLTTQKENFNWTTLNNALHLTSNMLSITQFGELESEIEIEEDFTNLKIILDGLDLVFLVNGNPLYETTIIEESKNYFSIVSKGASLAANLGFTSASTGSGDPGTGSEDPPIFTQTSPNVLKNYIHEKVYAGGDLIGEARTYFDKLDREVQGQDMNLETNHVIAAETLYDEFGRPHISSLPFSTYSGNFNYKSGLISFDDNVLAPAVNSDNKGTLGWYYSENNNEDGYVASSNYPYAQSTYYEDAPGRIKSNSKPGEMQKIGSGREDIYEKPTVVEKSELNLKGIPVFESKFICASHTNQEGQKVTVYVGKYTRITKVGDGDFCDADVEVKFEYFDARGNLLKMVPPAAYDCAFNNQNVYSNNTAQVRFDDLFNGASILAYTETFSSYNEATEDRRLNIRLTGTTDVLNHTLPTNLPPPPDGSGFRASDVWVSGNGNLGSNNSSSSTGCNNQTVSTVNGQTTIIYGLCPPDIDLLNGNIPNTLATPGAAVPSIGTGTESVPYQYGDWGYRFNVKLIGTLKTGGSQTLTEKTIGFKVHSSYQRGHELYLVDGHSSDYIQQGHREIYELESVDDPDNPFSSIDLSTFKIGEADIDLYSDVKIYIEDFQEAANFNPDGDFFNHTFANVASVTSSYPLNYLHTVPVFTEFEEFTEISEPFLNLNSYHYVYNDEDEVVKSYSPDAGIVKFMYNTQGDLRFFQNEEQSQSGNFFYINYDEIGRVVEQGEYVVPHTGGQLFFEIDGQPFTLSPGDTWIGDLVDLADGIPDSECIEQSFFAYDNPSTDLPAALNSALYPQTFTGGRLIKSWNAHRSTWYGYDIEGRLNWMVQDLEHIGVKTFAYNYQADHSVSEVIYQRETSAERLHHHYSYNDNRSLEKVATTTNGSANYTERVRYEYYDHGGLRREILGKNLQALDYIYTIQGQLKFINDPNLEVFDPGQDGQIGGNWSIGADLFGMALNYHANDYIRNDRDFYREAFLPSRYDGLIASQAWNSNTGGNFLYEDDILSYRYTYDGKGQLANATMGKVSNGTNNYHSFNAIDDYKVDLSYDKNGNIQSLKRNGNAVSGLSMDDFTYHYNVGARNLITNNRLLRVTDAVSNSVYQNDLKNQTQTSNYVYNEVGEMIEDKSENRSYTYNGIGLISSVTNIATSHLEYEYTYNENGKKQSQLYYNATGNPYKRTHYVYDAGDAVASIYDEQVGPEPDISLSEQLIYGLDRIGIFDRSGNQSLYEIKDHLTNVRMVIKGAGSDGIHTFIDDFYDPYEQHLFSPVPGFATTSINNGRLEVVVTNIGQDLEGITEAFTLKPNTSYRLKLSYGETQSGDEIRISVKAANGAFVYGGMLSVGDNIIEFTTNSSTNYQIMVFGEDQGALGVEYWVDDFVLQQKVELIAATDYYPFGSALPGHEYVSANGAYKYGYQGEFAEKDDNGYINFNLRQFDPRLGRWLTPDPMGQFSSAYLAMGNNPVSEIDPTGGLSAAYENHDAMLQDLFGLLGDIRLMSHLNQFGETPEDRYLYRDDLSNALKRLNNILSGGDFDFLDGLEFSSKHGAWGLWDRTEVPVETPNTKGAIDGMLADAPITLVFTSMFNMRNLKDKYEENLSKKSRNSFLDKLQGVIDVVGTIDPFGIADATNAVIYLARGDYKNAAISAISILPGGDILKAAKYTAIAGGVVTTAYKGYKKLKKVTKRFKKGKKQCFIAGTLVLASGGLKAIEDVQINDQVWAQDETNGARALKEVVNVFVKQADHLRVVMLANDTIYTTDEHPFYVAQNWVEAKDLQIGDILTRYSGATQAVVLNTYHQDTQVTVYNFEVKDYHTYFVGDVEVLVHNNNCGRSGKQPRLKEWMNDPKASKSDKGWLRNDLRHTKRASQPKSGLRIPRNGRKSPGRRSSDKGYELAHPNGKGQSASHGNGYSGSKVKNHAEHKVETRIHRGAGRY